MFAKFNMPPDFKGICTNRRSYYGKTNLYNTYYQWVSVYFMIQVKPHLTHKYFYTKIIIYRL